MKKKSLILILGLITFLINTKVTFAYTCRYNSANTTQKKGCGEFTINIEKINISTDVLSTYKNNIKFANGNMLINEFTVSDGWKSLARGELNGECPELYSKLNAYGDGKYCDIHFGLGDWDYTMYDDYIFEYGTNVEDPLEPTPLVPDDFANELYWTFGIEGHEYADAGSCIIGEPRYVYVEAIKRKIIACISTSSNATPSVSDDNPSITCGYAQYHDTYKATTVDGKITKSDNSPKFYAGVCYDVVHVSPGNPNPTKPETQTPDPYENKLNYNSLCANGDFRKVARILGIVLSIVKVVVPLIIIVLGIVDLTKAVASSDDKALSKATSSLIKRVIAGLIVYIIPIAIMGILNAIEITKGIEKESNSDFGACTKCIFSPYKDCSIK